MEKNGGVRKGAWTKEEDMLLKKCIEKFGEGNWHKVPLRAGLNRCRKSCRLRWLNYLRPNLKRGYFTKDEVDLILRLHKLLGNRWSLIAGRLPGRTANDVKNFWNTHIAKKSAAGGESCGEKAITESNIIKPRPRTFSKSRAITASCPTEATKTNETKNDENLDNKGQQQQPYSSASLSQEEPNDWKNGIENPVKNHQPFSFSEEEVDECIQWWSNLLEITEDGGGASFSFSDNDGPIMQPVFSPGLSGPGNNQTNPDGLSSFPVDADFWELISFNGQ